ncbi:hypothetical protein [Spirosoma litoris]
MNRQQNFKKIFAGTTINSKQVVSSLGKWPNHFPKMAGPKVLTEHVGYCKYLFKMFLMHPILFMDLFEEVGLLLEFEPQTAPDLLRQCLDSIKQLILDNEWYELMPRYEQGRRRLCQRFNLGC